jgi:MraZ protein
LLFTGHSEHAIDSKLRLAIPAKYRNHLSAERDGVAWYCVPWPVGVLRLYTEKRFEELSDLLPKSLLPGKEQADLNSRFFGFAERLDMDAQGRIAIPKLHLELADLNSPEIVIVGAGIMLEVRDRAAWVAARKQSFAELSELASRIEAKLGQ